MKTSNKILIAIGSTAVVMAIAALVVARIIIDDVVTVPLSSTGTTQSQSIGTQSGATLSYDFKGFTGIAASGVWNIRVREGAGYGVVISADSGTLASLDVYTRGGVLHVGLKPGTSMTNREMTAEITMPKLDRVQLSGANRAELMGFSGGSLSVECTGAASIIGSGAGYRDMRIDASGASSVRFRHLPTENADVRLSGAGQAELQMTGGQLTGQLSGAAKVTYWGSVSKQSIGTSGIASVTHR